MYVIASSMAGDELVQTRTVLNAILCFNGVNREIHAISSLAIIYWIKQYQYKVLIVRTVKLFLERQENITFFKCKFLMP